MSAETFSEELGIVGKIAPLRDESAAVPMRWTLPSFCDENNGTESNVKSDFTNVTPLRLRESIKSNQGKRKLLPEMTARVKWLGYVTDILPDGFVASFKSDGSDRKAIVAEFDFKELSADDLKILNVGSHLVWSIFTERIKGGIQNGSVLYVRRMPKPTNSEIECARLKLHEWFGNPASTST